MLYAVVASSPQRLPKEHHEDRHENAVICLHFKNVSKANSFGKKRKPAFNFMAPPFFPLTGHEQTERVTNMTSAWRLSVLVGLWFGAFICALFPFGEYQLEFMTGFVVLTMIWFFAVLVFELKDGWHIPKSAILLLAAAFWILVLSSLIWSEVKPITIVAIAVFSLFPMTFLGGVILHDQRFFAWIALLGGLVFFILGIWACIQYFMMNDYFWGQARHPLADPSSLGALLSLGLFCALGWMVFESVAWRRGMAVVLCAALIMGIMATVARGPIPAFIPGILVFCILLWPQAKLRWREGLVLLATAGVMFLAMSSHPEVTYGLGERMEELVNPPPYTDISNHRFSLWASTWEMIQTRPWLGHGMGTFFLYFPEFRSESYIAMAYHAHNDPLEFWFELGILGPLLFYTFLIAAVLRTAHALKHIPSAPDRMMIVTILSALTAMIVQSHVSFNLYNPSILMVTGFLLTLWFKTTGKYVDGPTLLLTMPPKAPKMASPVLLAIPMLMMGSLFMGIIGGEHYAGKARDYLFAHELESFTDAVNQSSQISGDMNYRAYILAVNVPLTILEMNKSTHTAEDQKPLYEQAKAYLMRVLEINPRSESAYYYLGQLHERLKEGVADKDDLDAQGYYQKALKMNALHLPSRLALYRIYTAQKRDAKEIMALMEPGMPLLYTTPMASQYYKTMAALYLEQGNYIKSREALQKLVEFQERSDFSLKRITTTIPQALMGSDPLAAQP